ncbi:MAG: 4'-phosphopantetheinyl transferase superfamily protein [Gammaproteobacteria bacterium]|nr:MAG: 4'-phosphopantetheinyl transferase superfamily protein [Gammaproteobacteria bacterium]
MMTMQLAQHDIHLWSADLTLVLDEKKRLFLSPDEHERANRFHFPLHRQRFIVARNTLRLLLSLYLSIPPQDIVFSYGKHHKPYLSTHPHLQFNLAHSHDVAVYAFTLDQAIGVDIEKIQNRYETNVAQRYFSPTEYQALLQLPEKERIMGFYRLWSRKEALIKAIGKGLSLPLSSFSVSVNAELEAVNLENNQWSLVSLPLLHPGYELAIASQQLIKMISYWHFVAQQPKLDKTYRF